MNDYFSRIVLSNRLTDRLTRHILFWTVWWLFMGFIYGFNYEEFFFLSYSEALIFMPMHMFLSYSILYVVVPQYIFKGKYWQGLFFVIVLIIITAFLSPTTNYFLIRPFREHYGYPIKNFTLWSSFMAGLRGSMTVAGFAVAIKLIKSWYLKKTENEQLEKEKLRAELQVLKGQVHPHFMFNTLNSIYALSLKKSDDTSGAILKLSQLMRYILTECNQPAVELTKEIEVLQHYIELEKGRFDNRLDMTVNIKGNLANNQIAPLLLLPFVENSFKHGAGEMIEQAWISLDVEVSQQTLKFKLINGRAAENGINPNSVGVGLQNVKKRLDLIYPNAHNLRINGDTDTFVVSLMINLDAIKTVEA